MNIAKIFSLQRTISGNSTANCPTMNEMLQFASQKGIRPQIELFPLSQVNQGIERVKSNAVRYRVALEI